MKIMRDLVFTVAAAAVCSLAMVTMATKNQKEGQKHPRKNMLTYVSQCLRPRYVISKFTIWPKILYVPIIHSMSLYVCVRKFVSGDTYYWSYLFKTNKSLCEYILESTDWCVMFLAQCDIFSKMFSSHYRIFYSSLNHFRSEEHFG